jgi:hypothetical protein
MANLLGKNGRLGEILDVVFSRIPQGEDRPRDLMSIG